MDNTVTYLARNRVHDTRLENDLPGAVNVTQSHDNGLHLSLYAKNSDGYVTPWSDVDYDGEAVGVLIVKTNRLSPYGGSSMTSEGMLSWLRGSSDTYMEVMAVRCDDVRNVRLHAPVDGELVIIKSGVFDMDSWVQMQDRGIIYFDIEGLMYVSESGYVLPPATKTTRGGVIVGDNLTVDADGRLSAVIPELPTATVDTKGGIKIGQGLKSAGDGMTSVKLGEGLEFDSNGNIKTTGGGSSSVDLSDYYTRDQVDGKFITKELADATYAKKSEIGTGGSGSGGDLSGYAKESWVQQNFEPIRKNDNGASSSEMKWWVAHGVVHISFAVRFGSGGDGSTTSVGTISSSYAPKYEVTAAVCGTHCNGYVQITTSGNITAVQTGGTSQTSGEYARGCASWGIDD